MVRGLKSSTRNKNRYEPRKDIKVKPLRKNTGNTRREVKKERQPRNYNFNSQGLVNFKIFINLTLSIIVSLCVLGTMVFGLFFAYKYVTTSDYFAIKDIKIIGNSHFSSESILKTIGIKAGDNSFAINISDIEESLASTPWVESVSVKRYLPDRFDIVINEKLPVFWVNKDNALYYADIEGNLIAPLEAKNFLSLPTLELGVGGDLVLPQLGSFIEILSKTDMPIEIGNASWVKLSVAKGFEIYLEKHDLILSIAKDSWNENLENLGLVLKDLAIRGEIKEASEIIASDGSVWVLKEK